jgi:hypothetical protein
MTKNLSHSFNDTSKLWLISFLCIGIIGRLIPHLPNMTPIISLSVLISLHAHRIRALMLMGIVLVISDTLLGFWFKQPIFGYWSYFTYSALMINTLMFSYQRRPSLQWLLLNTTAGALFFWLWTNLGVWLTTPFYTKTLHGFLLCYIYAIPFLGHTLIGGILWTSAYYIAIRPFARQLQGEFVQ